ncbi:UDP-glucose/GDP-mannose dehydrogenase family protein [Paenibacillus sp. XY044]|uniref:UDP-glucose dehydrogenase family protein n=1 Tax=Paenibacillus sp. XY044 TaxID=2026089 RepID=UPI000B993524|nr:UDP-glucose/GDP-mannose dehydrogenase family protein [Paenibacillus sp. XY044]OZB92150.1 nucleotide sugar dehydrogenase [Paenibacillus sp. XY044]
MNILVIGTGYVGTTTALVFAEIGWNVTGLDVNPQKIKLLRQGKLHFYEPGLEDLLKKHLGTKRIRFTTDKKKAIKDNDIIFICVGTPSLPDGSADLRYVKQVAEDIGKHMNSDKLIINKSTVPVGTQELITAWTRDAQTALIPFEVVSNPEFLREGKALMDALQPDRIIIGTNSENAAKRIGKLYESMQCPIIVTTPRTAEFTKYAANAFLATKISFINELAKLSDRLGVNVKEVAYGIGLDNRIGISFLQAGIGYGGSCFPKDVAALLNMAKHNDVELKLLKRVVHVNQTQHLYMLQKVRERIGNLAGKKVALLGLAFKPDTDDIREAPAIRMIQKLRNEMAYVQVYDPIATLPPELMDESIKFGSSPEETMEGADAAIICTEWPMFLEIDWVQVKDSMNAPNLFDGRNLLDADQMKCIGFYYQGIGYD